jgi:hypothetical protein
MAESEVQICNKALISVGASTITALTDESKEGRTCNALYTMCRDYVLRDVAPNFAVRRVALAQLTFTPTFNYAYAYQLPVDCMRVMNTDDKEYIWRIESYSSGGETGKILVTDEATIRIRYVSRIEDPQLHDAMFDEALATYLASELAYPLVNSNTLKEQRWNEYVIKLAASRGVDSMEHTLDNADSERATMEANEWIDSRI